MIRLKEKPQCPVNLKEKKVLTKTDEIRKKVASGTKPTSKEFTNYWGISREVLHKHQNSKCCYCERIRELKRESDLEHFRPKAKVEEDSAHFGYWWLAYDFNNYLFSCKICNEDYKKSKFPLVNPDSRAYKETDDLALEHPYLINPYDENPEDFIGYYWEGYKSKYVKMISKTSDTLKRAERTAEVAGLNRISLMEERSRLLIIWEGLVTSMHYALIKNSDHLIKKAHDMILSETSSKKAFTGFRRFFFIHNGLGQYIATD